MNQRILKFRAWVNENTYNAKNKMVIVSVLNEEGKIGYRRSNGSTSYLIPIQLMQFTGLHDKNGKEIWEGDIVTFTGLSRFHQTPFVIQWNEKCARYTDYSPKDQAEVIGNIYENPELLQAN